jgi:hypothetical protein
MATPWEQLVNIFGGNIQAIRDSIASGQTDVDAATLAQLNQALGGTTPYSGPGGAGIGLYPAQGGGTPPASQPPTAPTPAGPTTAPSGPTSSAKATLRAMLQPFGLESLVGPAYDLQIAGVTDPTAMVLALEGTQEFRARFAGIRDPTTGQMIMTPAEYVSYEKNVNQLFADNGVPLPDRAQIGSFVQQRRSVNELTTDVHAYAELKNNPFMQDQFYAVTGLNPGAEGMFAYLTGQAPGLEQHYNDSIAGGVDAATYAARLASTQTGANFTADNIMQALQTDPNSLFNAGTSPLNNMDKTIALQRAVASNAAEYKAGGQAGVSTQKIFTTF